MIRNISIFALALLFIFSACRREEDITTSTTTTFPTPVEWVNTNLAGLASTDDGGALANATVTVKTNSQTVSTTTNDVGYFFFSGVTVPKDGAMIRVEAPGYFPGLRRVTVPSGATPHTSIQLKAREAQDFATSETTITATYANTVQLTIPVGSLVDENNNPYSGSVSIANAHYDPAQPNFGREIPGGLDAINADGEVRVLGTYGMIGVEMTGSAGQELQIADGATATINMPIPADLLDEAPASIPLWHLDEATGIWIEEGSAEKQGDRYVGTVSHFSFWNCDIPFPYVNITGQALFTNGESVGQALVQISRENMETASSYTDQNGVFAGKVPADEELIIYFLNACNDVVLTQSLGSLSSDTDLGSFTLPINTATTVFGKLLDCDSEGVSNGIVYIEIDGNLNYAYPNADGTFSETPFDCGATTAEVWGVDFDQQLITETTTVALDNAEGDAGDLLACDELPFYLEYSIDGEDPIFFDQAAASVYQDSIAGGGLEDIVGISAQLPNQGGYFNFNFQGFTPGDYPISSLGYYLASTSTSGWWGDQNGQDGNVQVNITTYEDFPGGKVIGSFSGTFDQSTTTGVVTKEISGSFRAEKQ